MKRLVYFSIIPFLCLLPFSLIAATAVGARQIEQRVQAHMIIGDYLSACQEAYEGIQLYPDSKSLWQTYLNALAKAGEEKRMMMLWQQFIQRFPEEKENREVLECLAWAVIDKGAVASSPLIRVTAMLGAFFAQDAKGVAILRKALHDENSFLRAAALKLSSHLFDASLQDEMLEMFKTESVLTVRLELIQAIKELRTKAARPQLEAILWQDNSHIEEKIAAIEGMVHISDGIENKQLMQLVKSNRVGMRLLACELVTFFEQIEDVDILFPLIYDYHADVRAKVLQTMGQLRVSTIAGQSVIDIVTQMALDKDPLVAVTAAWVLTLNDPPKGLQAFAYLLQKPEPETQNLAAAGLAATGKYGLSLTRQAFQQNYSAYVKMNLALGLIAQRQEVQAACDCLYNGLAQKKERWAWNEKGHFRLLAPSEVKHDDAIPNYPEVVNQLTRLEVLNVLSIVHYPQAQQAIKSFLQETHWGISGLASALLLTEGDEDAILLVKKLLNDPEQKVKVQAALILALWGEGEDCLPLLEKAYFQGDRELKGQILEGIGRVGSASSLSFLAERLQEPYQSLRIIVAAALLECLYH